MGQINTNENAMNSTFLNLSGNRYGRLIVTDKHFLVGERTYWECKCDCGKTSNVCAASLRKKNPTKSCGCLLRDVCIERSTIHGLCKHPLYRVWASVLGRCYNRKAPAYKWYGKRGVVMCDEWKNEFKSFYDWAILNGWTAGLKLDKDKKGNGLIYSPETCCFVTHKENCRYRSNSMFVKYKGETRPFKEWCENLGINISTARHHLRMGKSFSYSVKKQTGKPQPL